MCSRLPENYNLYFENNQIKENNRPELFHENRRKKSEQNINKSNTAVYKKEDITKLALFQENKYKYFQINYVNLSTK